ncbi:MAG: methionine--tRNA ligase [Sphingobacteriales bacterium]|nr:methionine--tRNA ligase [Sphingobacteriales bacterium]
MPQKYLVTSALPYANGPFHIGHIAGAYLSADIYVRWLRLCNEDVVFVCGSDEHGAAITIQAKREGKTPRELIDLYHEQLKQGAARLGISFDIYHRTSDPIHHQTSQDFFKVLYDKGVFIEKVSEQLYDETAQMFLADRYVKGTCPKCGHDAAYGDQCEKCGSSLDPLDLINPVSTLSGSTPILRQTKHWYLPLGNYTEWVSQWIDEQQNTETWKKQVYKQCQSWIEQGLRDRAITRDIDWGVPVPLPDAEGKVLYVWMDAPIGYISATKALLPDTWQDYWQNPDTKLVHFIGKDNIVFHCLIFPIMLHAHGNFVLPTNVPANQFLNLEGEKLSTSRNYAVWLLDYLNNFPGMEDVLRYTLTAIMPETKDSDFSWKDLQTRNNSELVAILGNLVNRVIVLLNKNFEGKIPDVLPDPRAIIEDAAFELRQYQKALHQNLNGYIHRYEFRNALQEILNVARVANKFLTDTEPWKLIKTNPDQAGAVLTICAEIIAYFAVYLEPFLPFSANKLRHWLLLSDEDIEAIKNNTFTMETGRRILNTNEYLFRKIEDAEIAPYIAQLEAKRQTMLDAQKTVAEATTETQTVATHTPVKEAITYDDFAKLDIRTATIIAAERVPKADKLLKLTIDLGFEQRTVVSGIAEHYTPESIVGQRVLLLANLAPRKLRGIESNGMILMAGDGKTLQFVSPEGEIENGNVVS